MFKSFGPSALGINVSYEKAAKLASIYGFGGLQVNVNFLKKEGSKKAKEILDKYNLLPGSFGLPVDINAEKQSYSKSLDNLKEVAKLASEINCTRCSTYIMPFSDDKDFSENFEYHREKLNKPAEILADFNIRLGLEFLGPETLRTEHKYEFIHSIEGMLELASALDSDNVGLLLDVWHWYTSGENINSLKMLSNKDVVDVHVNDAPANIPVDQQMDLVRCLPAETGVINIKDFMRHLEEIGYDGPVMVEPFSKKLDEMQPEEAAETTSNSLKKIWP